MKKFRLSEDLNVGFVDGVIDGYKDYLRVRKEAAKNLKIHGAYAWVKGNHIDHHVAVQCEKLGIVSKLSKAGITWQYLQFQNEAEKALFLVKNARYFDPNAVDKGVDANGRPRTKKATYMENLVYINEDVNFPEEVDSANHRKSIQLELIEDPQKMLISKEEADEVVKQFEKFYIITYEIDEEFLIHSIMLWMPNPVNNKAYLVEDLSMLINTKPSHIIEMEEETKAILQSSMDAEYDASSYDIALTEDEIDETTRES
ncbi:hypothetical protein I6G82_20610 [Lysinibacillus macroides]|uniref:Uncharacterized protein n=1 Tax=Lysinibacillus macroides TaxID=33935 RepID=A0A0M9DF85_9BACI|nr:hypothetical protein [Lysinibacillus macroides]KOY80268.1 hypothetical protein ADM90_20685 [Lysinibacillus macroides]QPR67573.1 hypothetical protein I6G82_20610 [Lysinibacillus macroides]